MNRTSQVVSDDPTQAMMTSLMTQSRAQLATEVSGIKKLMFAEIRGLGDTLREQIQGRATSVSDPSPDPEDNNDALYPESGGENESVDIMDYRQEDEEMQLGDSLYPGRDSVRIKASQSVQDIWSRTNSRGSEYGPEDWKQITGLVIVKNTLYS